jgi:hypothetical protein
MEVGVGGELVILQSDRFHASAKTYQTPITVSQDEVHG